MGRRQNWRWEIPSFLVWHCQAKRNSAGDVRVCSRRQRGDITGKWAVEEGSTHQCFCLGNWLPTAKGRNPSRWFGSAKEQHSRAGSRRRSWSFHLSPGLSCPVAGRREEKDKSAVCQGPAIAGCELWRFHWSAKPPPVLSPKLGCGSLSFPTLLSAA